MNSLGYAVKTGYNPHTKLNTERQQAQTRPQVGTNIDIPTQPGFNFLWPGFKSVL